MVERAGYTVGLDGDFFKLENDSDSAEVRFLYKKYSDIKVTTAHKIVLDPREEVAFPKPVDCLRFNDEPFEKCALCEDPNYFTTRSDLFLFDMFVLNKSIIVPQEGNVTAAVNNLTVWSRSPKMYAKLGSALRKCQGELVSNVFEITRIGKAGSMQTEYNINWLRKDDVTLESLPSIKPIRAKALIIKTNEEMKFYIAKGYFEEADDNQPARNTSEPTEREIPATPSNDSNF